MDNPNVSSPGSEVAPAPQPSQETASPAVPEQAPAAPTPEKKTGASEGANQNAGMPLPPVMQQAPQAQPTPVPATNDKKKKKKKADIGKTPSQADDVDVLEKEWVEKTKAVVDKTKSDPHQQNEEVSALKSDYMKKRYGKDVKLTED